MNSIRFGLCRGAALRPAGRTSNGQSPLIRALPLPPPSSVPCSSLGNLPPLFLCMFVLLLFETTVLGFCFLAFCIFPFTLPFSKVEVAALDQRFGREAKENFFYYYYVGFFFHIQCSRIFPRLLSVFSPALRFQTYLLSLLPVSYTWNSIEIQVLFIYLMFFFFLCYILSVCLSIGNSFQSFPAISFFIILCLRRYRKIVRISLYYEGRVIKMWCSPKGEFSVVLHLSSVTK